jgi:hypothetical protein
MGASGGLSKIILNTSLRWYSTWQAIGLGLLSLPPAMASRGPITFVGNLVSHGIFSCNYHGADNDEEY